MWERLGRVTRVLSGWRLCNGWCNAPQVHRSVTGYTMNPQKFSSSSLCCRCLKDYNLQITLRSVDICPMLAMHGARCRGMAVWQRVEAEQPRKSMRLRLKLNRHHAGQLQTENTIILAILMDSNHPTGPDSKILPT